MNPFSNTNKTIVILLLVAEMLTVTAAALLLGKYFDFPDVLRQPADAAFARFAQNRSLIVPLYYIFLLSSLLYIPLSYWLQQVLQDTTGKLALRALSGLGIATAIFQAIGFVRWIFMMPYLTDTYYNQPETKHTITIVYEMMNRFAGMSIGEHLGFIAMGSWTILLGIVLINHAQFKPWLGYAGLFISFLLLISVLEHFGGEDAAMFGTLNFLANTLWAIWLVAVAVQIGLVKTEPA